MGSCLPVSFLYMRKTRICEHIAPEVGYEGDESLRGARPGNGGREAEDSCGRLAAARPRDRERPPPPGSPTHHRGRRRRRGRTAEPVSIRSRGGGRDAERALRRCSGRRAPRSFPQAGPRVPAAAAPLRRRPPFCGGAGSRGAPHQAQSPFSYQSHFVDNNHMAESGHDFSLLQLPESSLEPGGSQSLYQATSVRTRQNGLKLCQRKFRWDMKINSSQKRTLL
ncbi:uncharacterized protein LOC130256289 [Oenanthe melanoleuca]|uniref:uncharacterized protein LOC130256289 n=1 Tax=Oenanthe melanoleuca TaxID=2939378 RepID=UPI0024C1731B|nr:uncharacterized protein LOC130256289 [Oenanthe melanoleuca]